MQLSKLVKWRLNYFSFLILVGSILAVGERETQSLIGWSYVNIPSPFQMGFIEHVFPWLRLLRESRPRQSDGKASIHSWGARVSSPIMDTAKCGSDAEASSHARI